MKFEHDMMERFTEYTRTHARTFYQPAINQARGIHPPPSHLHPHMHASSPSETAFFLTRWRTAPRALHPPSSPQVSPVPRGIPLDRLPQIDLGRQCQADIVCRLDGNTVDGTRAKRCVLDLDVGVHAHSQPARGHAARCRAADRPGADAAAIVFTRGGPNSERVAGAGTECSCFSSFTCDEIRCGGGFRRRGGTCTLVPIHLYTL